MPFRFSVAALVSEPDLREMFLEGQRTRYYVANDEGSRYPKLNRLLMGRCDQIHIDDDRDLQEAMAQHRGVVAGRQEEQQMTALMLGRDNATVSELAKKW